MITNENFDEMLEIIGINSLMLKKALWDRIIKLITRQNVIRILIDDVLSSNTMLSTSSQHSTAGL